MWQSYDESAEAQYSEQVQEAQSEGESAQDVAPPAFVDGNGTGPARLRHAVDDNRNPAPDHPIGGPPVPGQAPGGTYPRRARRILGQPVRR